MQRWIVALAGHSTLYRPLFVAFDREKKTNYQDETGTTVYYGTWAAARERARELNGVLPPLFLWQCEECGTVREFRYGGGCYRLMRCVVCGNRTEHVQLPTTVPVQGPQEYRNNTPHDWLYFIGRKVRQYGKHPTPGTAAAALRSIQKMVHSLEAVEATKDTETLRNQ